LRKESSEGDVQKFSKLKLTVVAIFIALAGVLAMTPETSANSTFAGEMSSPRSLYTQNCASCHGANGKAQTRLGKKLDADDISGGTSASKTTRVVTNGKGKMPSFKKRLSAAQIAQIAGYVSSL
jgi:mono/diheme cytochrome c family protein